MILSSLHNKAAGPAVSGIGKSSAGEMGINMDKKVKWGVIGAGGIADRRTMPGMMKAGNAELIAVMDTNAELIGKLKEKYNAKYAYTTADELIANPEVEAIYIASPVVFHAEQAVKAAKAGKHILLEKPIAMTVAEGKKVVEDVDNAGVLSACGFMMRFGAYNQKIKEIIENGVIGQVVSAKAQFTCWYPDMPNCWRQVKKNSGGGAFVDMGVHCIDLIQHILDTEVEKVSAIIDTKTFKYEVDDSSSVLMHLKNGVNAFVEANFNIPDAAAKWRLEFYGTKGCIIAHDTIHQLDTGSVEITLDDGSHPEINVNCTDLYTKEIESFSNSILTGAPVEVPLKDGLQVQQIVEAAYYASDNDKVVNVKDYFNK